MSELSTYRPHAMRWLEKEYGEEYSEHHVESLTYLLAGCAADGENKADRVTAEIDKLRRHALSLAKALDNIEVMTDDETEIRWTAKNALDVYFAAYPREGT